MSVFSIVEVCRRHPKLGCHATKFLMLGTSWYRGSALTGTGSDDCWAMLGLIFTVAKLSVVDH